MQVGFQKEITTISYETSPDQEKVPQDCPLKLL